MSMKELAFPLLFALVVAGGVGVCTAMPRARDWILGVLVLGTVRADLVDINYLSREWYRGSTRGIEINWLDMLVWVLLIVGLMNRDRTRPWHLPAGFAAMGFYFAYCVVNVAMNEPKLLGLFELSKILRGMVLYLVVANTVRSAREARVVALAVCIALCYEGYLAVTQRYLGGRNRVPGSFDHANSLSMYCCMGVAVAAATFMSNLPNRQRWLAGAAVLCGVLAVVLTQSRTGFVTVILTTLSTLAMCGMFRPTPRNIMILAAIVAGGGAIVYKAWDTIGGRMAENAQEITDDPTQGRNYYFNLAKLIVKDKPGGAGLNNWSYVVTNKYGAMLGMEYNAYPGTDSPPDTEVPRGSPDLAQAAPAHSLVALTVGELGWPGLVVFGICWLNWFATSARFLARRTSAIESRLGMAVFFAMSACFLQSQTEWEFRQTPMFTLFHILAASAAGLLWARRHARARRRTAASGVRVIRAPSRPAGAGTSA